MAQAGAHVSTDCALATGGGGTGSSPDHVTVTADQTFGGPGGGAAANITYDQNGVSPNFRTNIPVMGDDGLFGSVGVGGRGSGADYANLYVIEYNTGSGSGGVADVINGGTPVQQNIAYGGLGGSGGMYVHDFNAGGNGGGMAFFGAGAGGLICLNAGILTGKAGNGFVVIRTISIG